MMRYAVQGKHPPDAEDRVLAIITAYVETCDEAGLDALLVVSVLLLETDNLTSASLPLHLDSVGRSSPGPSFSSWTKAARAHAGLLLAYALPAGRENKAQLGLLEEALRWRSVPPGLRGSAPTLERLAGTWTADENYPDSVREIANTILTPQH